MSLCFWRAWDGAISKGKQMLTKCEKCGRKAVTKTVRLGFGKDHAKYELCYTCEKALTK